MNPEDLVGRYPPCMNCGHFRGSHAPDGCTVTLHWGPPEDRHEEVCGCGEFVGVP
jgi:hypothetical protein